MSIKPLWAMKAVLRSQEAARGRRPAQGRSPFYLPPHPWVPPGTPPHLKHLLEKASLTRRCKFLL